MQTLQPSACSTADGVSADRCARLRPLLCRRRAGLLNIVICGTSYELGDFCGRGAVADVHEAKECGSPVALKAAYERDRASVAWEFLLLQRLHGRIDAAHAPLFLKPLRLHILADCCIFVSPFCSHGTLQDAINTRGGLSELLAAFFSIELLRCLEVLHDAHIAHGDVKPDNILLRLGGGGEAWTEWEPGCNWWRDWGLTLIDWGESIDLRDYPAGSVFVGDAGTKHFSCIPMQTGAPWRWQQDAYSALGCIHAMLHGSYMDVERADDGRWRCRTPLKRYWALDIWAPLFDTLLNLADAEAAPLSSLRATLEQFLGHSGRARVMRKELLELTVKVAG